MGQRQVEFLKKSLGELFDFCAQEFKREKQIIAGASLTDHEAALRKMGAPIPPLKVNKSPENVVYLFYYFCKIKRTPEPLSNMELDSFLRMRSLHLATWEIDVIFKIDQIWGEN